MQRSSYNVDGIGSTENQEPESKRPDNTAFKQQRLPAWQPILTPKSVFPTFILVTVVFIPLGAVLLVASNNVVEASVDYTRCLSTVDGSPCSNVTVAQSCMCNVNITVPSLMEGDIYIYYGLSNFFQNHRRYVKSRDDNQLNGKVVSLADLSNDCKPYRSVNNTPIAPCGAIANSLFNDTFSFSDNSIQITRTGIAWETDHSVKFNNPPFPAGFEGNLTAAFAGTARPFFWTRNVYELDVGNLNNNGYKNEAFEVWMRTAAFPTFRKLYGILNVKRLESGVHELQVNYAYPVTAFDGTKRIILSTTSFVGGKNSFLGISYLVVGCLSFAVALGLLVIHFITKRRQSSN